MGKKYFLPPGSRDIVGIESEKLWEVESKLTSLFSSSGLKRIYPPLLEYRQVFSRGIGNDKEKKTYKLVDPASGELLVLRSDITPQIVRLWWSRGYPANFGVFYFERIVRIESAYSGVEREIFQGGIELLNFDSPEERVLEILWLVLKQLNLEDVTVVAGSTDIVSNLLKLYPDLEDCFRRRDISCMEKKGVDPHIVKLALKLGVSKKNLPSEISIRIDELESLFMNGGEYTNFIVDPFLFPPSSYYNGIVFSVISGGKELIVGGRYDGLLERFGKRAAAAGFAIDLFSLVSLI